MAFAGPWERRKDRGPGKVIDACAVIVTDANEPMTPMHDRVVATLTPEDFGRWRGQEVATLSRCDRCFGRPRRRGQQAHPGSKAVNKLRNQGPESLPPQDPAGFQCGRERTAGRPGQPASG